ncbi:hypothetical protein GBF38_000918 [Nibea albiflora]|nr:hypothetical protein GBF38_000918 [Nibea albiflora]
MQIIKSLHGHHLKTESVSASSLGGAEMGRAGDFIYDHVQVLDSLRGRLRDYVQVLDSLRGRLRDYVQVLDSLRGRLRDYVQVLDSLRGRLRDYVQVLDSLRGRHRDYVQVLDSLRGRHRDYVQVLDSLRGRLRDYVQTSLPGTAASKKRVSWKSNGTIHNCPSTSTSTSTPYPSTPAGEPASLHPLSGSPTPRHAECPAKEHKGTATCHPLALSAYANLRRVELSPPRVQEKKKQTWQGGEEREQLRTAA